MAGFDNNRPGGSRFERVGFLQIKGKWSNWLPFEKFLFPHLFETRRHLWDQKSPKSPHRNPLKKGSLSENVMKKGERVLFQPLHRNINRRGSCCGHFATSTTTTGGSVPFSSRHTFFWNRERKILASFGQLRIFCGEFMHFLAYLFKGLNCAVTYQN